MPRVVDFITRQEFEEILQIVEDDRADAFIDNFGLLLRAYWATGCRVSELVGRKGRDGRAATEDRRRISRVKPHHGLRRQDILPDHRLHIEGKNTSPQDSSKLKPRVVLCANTQTWRDIRELAETYSDPTVNIFLPESSNGIQGIRRYVWKLRDRLSGRLRNFSLSWMRHSHAVHALRNGVDMMSLQRQLGHQNLRTTANYLQYAGLDEGPYLDAFGSTPVRRNHDCPSCGFAWQTETETGHPTWEARMGRAFRSR